VLKIGKSDAVLLQKIKDAASAAEDEAMMAALDAAQKRDALAATARKEQVPAMVSQLKTDQVLRTAISAAEEKHGVAVATLDAADVALHGEIASAQQWQRGGVAVMKSDAEASLSDANKAALLSENELKDHLATEDGSLHADITDVNSAVAYGIADEQTAHGDADSLRAGEHTGALTAVGALGKRISASVATESGLRKSGDKAVRSDMATFENDAAALQADLRSNFDASVSNVAEDRGTNDQKVHTDEVMNLKAVAASNTNNLRREAAASLQREAGVRTQADGELRDAAIAMSVVSVDGALIKMTNDLDTKLKQDIAAAVAHHDKEVAALRDQDDALAQAITSRVSAAEGRNAAAATAQEARTQKLLQASQAKADAADAAAGALIKKLQDQSDAILGKSNPSTAACAATTVGLCDVRAELHGGVAGTCNPKLSTGGWCSFRCNNGEFRGEDGCNPATGRGSSVKK
jgi:hypothetical protein